MAGCPVYIWGPALIAAAPFSRTVRDKARIFKEDILGIGRPTPADEEAPVEERRWSPIDPHAETHHHDAQRESHQPAHRSPRQPTEQIGD